MDRKHKAMNWTALVTALAGIIGGGGHAYLNSDDKDDIKTKVAAEFAAYGEWKAAATKDIEDLKKESRGQRDIIIKLQATLEANGSRRIRRDLQELGGILEPNETVSMPARVSRAPKPLPERVSEQKQKMFPVD